MSNFFKEWGHPKKMTYEQMRVLSDPLYYVKKNQKRLEIVNNDPYAFASMKYSKQKSRALRDRNLAWRLDQEKVIKDIAESTNCSLSGRTLVHKVGHPDSPSIDRKNSSLGYTKSNIQIVSSRINIAKNDMSDDEFIQLCRDVVKYQDMKTVRG